MASAGFMSSLKMAVAVAGIFGSFGYFALLQASPFLFLSLARSLALSFSNLHFQKHIAIAYMRDSNPPLTVAQEDLFKKPYGMDAKGKGGEKFKSTFFMMVIYLAFCLCVF